MLAAVAVVDVFLMESGAEKHRGFFGTVLMLLMKLALDSGVKSPKSSL